MPTPADYSDGKPGLFARWWKNWKARDAAVSELRCCDRAEETRIAQDVGVSVSELRTLAGRWPDSAGLLERRMSAAGLNAAACAIDVDPVTFDRRTSYLGVMIDDLTLQGVSEPYRMMTARSEYRLALRADNSTTRLGSAALAADCVSNRRRLQIETHFEARRSSAWAETEEGEADALYAPYLERQQREWDAVRRDVGIAIPPALGFASIPGISTEMAERLESARPETLDQASRIRGVTPAALSALYVAACRRAA